MGEYPLGLQWVGLFGTAHFPWEKRDKCKARHDGLTLRFQ